MVIFDILNGAMYHPEVIAIFISDKRKIEFFVKEDHFMADVTKLFDGCIEVKNVIKVTSSKELRIQKNV